MDMFYIAFFLWELLKIVLIEICLININIVQVLNEQY